jgi:hypothetical protein
LKKEESIQIMVIHLPKRLLRKKRRNKVLRW